jgi:E3 ubiquitin-protein ligase NRDP1
MKRQTSIRDLRVLSAEDDTAHLRCSICHEILVEARACRLGHVFCKECVTPWVGKNPTCPVDRGRLTADDLVVPPFVNEFLGRSGLS